MSTKTTLWLIAAAALTGCGYGIELVPAPSAEVVPDAKAAARAKAGDIDVVVAAQAWHGDPANLEAYVTPMRVRIENHGHRPVKVAYPLFALVTSDGFHHSAMSPFEVSRPGSPSVGPTENAAPEGSTSGTPPPLMSPHYEYHHFRVAPHLHGWYSSIAVWPEPFYDPLWGPYPYDWYVTWRPALPTREMVEEALPEGVVDPDGTVEGFLYFQRLREDVTEATFTMKLVDAETGEAFGEVRVPFVSED